MDPFDCNVLGDGELSFDALLNNNFPDNLDFEQELEKNAMEFEKAIFGGSQNTNVGNIFDVIGGVDAEKLLEAIDTVKGEK
jgi:muramoyltetrapeptide carboxypeptidase LdcA involved in peptidoglycan recycling